MRVLHFCSYYVGSKVYFNMVKHLSNFKPTFQYVFVPIRSRLHYGVNAFESHSVHVEYIYLLSILTRLFLSAKVFIVLVAALIKIRRKYDVVHAHTLYSDGIAAYIFSRIRGSRFVVTIRNTDVNLGIKYFPQYRRLVRHILLKADAVVFVSPKHKERVLGFFDLPDSDSMHVIPNGVEGWYISNRLYKKKVMRDGAKVRCIYVGAINKNKNLCRSIEACQIAFGDNWSYTVVGGDYNQYVSTFGALPQPIRSRVKFEGFISGSDNICALYDHADIFCMPSRRETFGLVYIEAISRCLPVVYTRNEGIDGYFPDGMVGFSCDPDDVESIAAALRMAVLRFPQGLGPYFENHPVDRFSWSVIAKEYVEKVYAI